MWAERASRRFPSAPLEETPQFHNTYEHAKFEAEQWLLQKMEAGFPATIFRPSMVVGDTQTGKIIRFQVFYFLAAFLTGQRTAGILPRLRRRSAGHHSGRLRGTSARFVDVASRSKRKNLPSGIGPESDELGAALRIYARL